MGQHGVCRCEGKRGGVKSRKENENKVKQRGVGGVAWRGWNEGGLWRKGVGEEMTKAEVLKKEILRQYRSVRQFAMEMGIPYSTLVTALERGVEGMAYGTVIKMCDKLSLNPVDFSSLERDATLGAQLLENRVMVNYVKLNQDGRDKILELMEDFAQIEKYKVKIKKGKKEEFELE